MKIGSAKNRIFFKLQIRSRLELQKAGLKLLPQGPPGSVDLIQIGGSSTFTDDGVFLTKDD